MSLSHGRRKWGICTVINAYWVTLLLFSTFNINWESFHVNSGEVCDECTAGAIAIHWFKPPRWISCRSDLNLSNGLKLSHPTFIYICMWGSHSGSVCWSSPCVLFLWISEVNICNLKTIVIIFLRDTKHNEILLYYSGTQIQDQDYLQLVGLYQNLMTILGNESRGEKVKGFFWSKCICFEEHE